MSTHPEGAVGSPTGPPAGAERPWWEPELTRRREFAEGLGGPEAIERHHDAGRLTARERIEALVDPGSWRETGVLTGRGDYDEHHRLVRVTPSSVVAGVGAVQSRALAVVAEDFTVRGGSSEATSPDKWQYVERLALEYRMPLVRLVDTAGGSVALLKQSGGSRSRGFPSWPVADLLATVPVVGVAMGAAAGLGAVRVVCSHFSVMVAGRSYVFAAGPRVVKAAVGEDVSAEELGGATMHVRRSGMVDNEASSELEALDQVRAFLSYLPPSVHELPPVADCDDPADRADEWLATAIPRDGRKPYAVRAVLDSVFDSGSVFEIGRYHGRSQVTALARLDGHPVAVLANDPKQWGGALTADSAEKLMRFVDLADTFHLPVVNLMDQPGTFVGSAAESRGTVRVGLRAALAIEQSRVPWATVFIRRAFGLAGSAYGPLGRHVNWRVAWPTAHWGSIPIAGGVESAYRREIESSPDPEATRRQLYAELAHLEDPFLTAERFGINDIIDPRTTRATLCEWVRGAYRLLPEQLGVSRRTTRC